MPQSKVLSLIPARGGSKGLPRKNIKELCGEPLIAYTINAARESKRVDRTLLSTDDREIRNTALEYGAEAPFLRPESLAKDETPTEPVVEHALQYVRKNWMGDWETLVLLQPTSPLRDEEHIDEALLEYAEADANSLVSVFEDHSYRWEKTGDGARRINYSTERTPRQEKSPDFVENGAIYIVDINSFLGSGDLQYGTTELYVMDESSSVDIDNKFEFWMAERIASEWR
ncbi:acylneuraminate cytidylyltransferase family protein [Salinibacter ruber]|uniref:acylneuraminate cytidylyltransferase family protein n=1 Tax=Salinibacter ruber TaxID=146919 RepID=UPI002169C554|nr:acylneuraminate cytidylyltransferase family protein [Salinibacter ruber]MCS4198106.1 N-acylneuraminate cytidylyltransferase/CMP-N,N'-diacetyllegionaminic acid synthase [Salinibacter ruber]